MPTPPSEPEKYSVDEILARLKSTSLETSQDGEQVTRADGSQAIRTRQRKRRSSQPRKAKQQRTRLARIVQVSLALILILLIALTLGGAVIYANSKPFRDELVRHIAQASGATTELQEFRMNPQTANAARLSLTWPEGNVLKNLTLHDLSAEIFPSSFWGTSMSGEEITIPEGSLELRIPQLGQSLRHTPEPQGPLPVQFNRYRIPKFNLTLGDPKQPLVQLFKSEASLNPFTVNGYPQMSLYRGELTIMGWPKLRLNRALIEFRGPEIHLVSLRVSHEADKGGIFEFSGTIYPYQAERTSTLDLVLDSFDLSGLVGPTLGNLFSGKINSQPLTQSNFLSFLPTEHSTPTLDIAFQPSPISRIQLQGFPFLFSLKQILADTWFLTPSFDHHASGKFHREHGIVTLRDLNFESKSQMALRGEISMAPDQSLSGNLQIGLTEAKLATANNLRLNSLFGPLTAGYRWLPLKITGSATNPHDNFRELLATAKIAPLENAPPPAQTSIFEQLTQPK